MDDGTLTPDKMERIHRCRVRYQAGYPLPASDLHALGVTLDLAGAKEVLGFFYDPKRPPAIEGTPRPMSGPIFSATVT